MPTTEQVTAGNIYAGDRIYRDGVERVVAEVDHSTPRQTSIVLEGGGLFTIGKRAKLERVVSDAAVDPVDTSDAPTVDEVIPPVPVEPVRTISITELEDIEYPVFVRWHGTPHRVDYRDDADPDEHGNPRAVLALQPWIEGADQVLTEPLVLACRFVVIRDPGPKLKPSEAIEQSRPTAATVGRGPAVDTLIVAELEGGGRVAGVVTSVSDDGKTFEVDPAPNAIPDFVRRANDAEHPDVAAAGRAIINRGGPMEQVRPGSAIPAPTDGGDVAPERVANYLSHNDGTDSGWTVTAPTPPPADPDYAVIVEVYRPTLTAGIYNLAATVEPAEHMLVRQDDPITDEDAIEACRDTLDRVDQLLDDTVGWAAAGPWQVDASAGFLLAFLRPVRRVS